LPDVAHKWADSKEPSNPRKLNQTGGGSLLWYNYHRPASASIGDSEPGNALAHAESNMTEYTVHIGDGRSDSIITLDCADDAAALEAAALLINQHDVAVWRGYRKLGTLHHYMRAKVADKLVVGNVAPLRGATRGRPKRTI
jgi:hypothetical protein